MKYWAYLIAKLTVALGIMYVLRRILILAQPVPSPYSYYRQDPFAHDLTYTFLMLLYSLFGAGLIWLIVLDQRYRCRSCLRRLRMPIQTGSWTHVLFGAPRTEYICLYGHGTLKIDDLQLTGRQGPDWEPHEDMWKELCSLEDSKK